MITIFVSGFLERRCYFLAKSNFFADMRQIDSCFQSSGGSERGEGVFRHLVSFIEEGSFTKSVHVKFICKNWRLSTSGLADAWESQSGTRKSENTVRSQVSVASSQLLSMFPSFSKDIFMLSDVSSEDELALSEIEAIIDSMSGSSLVPSGVFIDEVVNYPDSLDYIGSYTIEECSDVIRAIKPFMKSEVFRYLDEVDLDKLKFVLSVLSEPMASVHDRSVNVQKVQLLKALGLSDSESLQSGEVVKVIEKRVAVEVPEKVPYNLKVTKSMCDVLTKRLNTPATHDESVVFQGYSSEEKEEQRLRVRKLLNAYCEKGFEEYMNRVNVLMLKEVVEDFFMK